MKLIFTRNEKMNIQLSIKLLLIVLFVGAAQCFPQLKDNRWLRRDEIRLPNGTVVGKYLYYDKEGAAVDVKYFADDSGYGVELKSLKISSIKPGEVNLDSRQVIEGRRLLPNEPKDFNPMDLLRDENIDKGTNTLDNLDMTPAVAKKDIITEDYGKNEPSQYGRTPEYDVFVEQKLDSVQDRNKKAKVYFNRNKRGHRTVPGIVKMDMNIDYCDDI